MRFVLLLLAACSSPPAAQPVPVTTSQPPARETAPNVGHPYPSEAMVQQMIGQRVLDHPRVTPFLHPEVHTPFVVYTVPDLAEGAASWRVGGTPVRVAATPDEANLRITALETTPGTARRRVRFEMPAEGMSGYVDLELRDYVWEYVGAEVVER